MLGKLTREHEADGGLDLPRRKCLLLVVSDELDSFLSDSVEDVIDEGVHDAHGLLGDTSVRVDLL